MRGIHINFPFKLGSVWVEWRERSVGFGYQRHPAGDREVFLGRVQGVWSPAAPTTADESASGALPFGNTPQVTEVAP